METRYYIYHIPTYVHKDGKIGKIGATDDIKGRIAENQRTSQQPFDFWEVLEEHTDIMEVSRREIELQKQYGYKVDKCPYFKSNEMGKSGAGGKKHVESGHWASIRTKESCSRGGKTQGPIQGKKNVESGHIFALGKLPNYFMRKLTYEDAQQIRELYSKKTHSQMKLGEIYGVAQAAISAIINKKTYTQP
jgi:hypothetical protein